MQVKRNKIIAIFIFIITLLSLIMRINRAFASEYPFLKNGDFTERGCFYTSCPNSSSERKNNIALAVKEKKEVPTYVKSIEVRRLFYGRCRAVRENKGHRGE